MSNQTFELDSEVTPDDPRPQGAGARARDLAFLGAPPTATGAAGPSRAARSPTRCTRIVNNESADIVRMLDAEFGDSVLRPDDLADEIDAIGPRIYAGLQNAVYEAGFARSQAAYEEAAGRVFETLAWLEDLLGERRYLAGDRVTEADWRLFPTLVRFDAVYVDHFRCNLRRLVDHPNVWGYTRELYQRPGIGETVEMEQIKRHYYTTHDSLEPSRIIPIGPELDFWAPHGRG
jgi:putative glutathione S-transferase